jgi:hypothetical protein
VKTTGRNGKRRGRKPTPIKAGANEMNRLKKAFVDELRKGTVSLQSAANSIGREPITIWRWRRADPGFDAEVLSAVEDSDSVRVGMVEDSYFARLVSGNVSAAEVIFYLANRAPERWKHVSRHEHTGKDGAPLPAPTTTVLIVMPENGRTLAPAIAVEANGNGVAAHG